MGALLTLRRGWAAVALAATGLLAGCETECVPRQRVLALEAPYNQFFNRAPACTYTTAPPVAASSSTGLTDSFSGCLNVSQSYLEASTSACETVSGELRSTYAFASLYGYSFVAQVEQLPDGPQLLVRDQSPGTGVPYATLTYRFATGQAQATYLDASANITVPFAQAPAVTELRNFQSGTRTYAQVWRITNPLNAAQGRVTAATVFYIDRDYGLIRFEQRDGTSWTLAL
ncbi:hypothetical protein ACFST9_00425 [Hymenobacter monticola]|uniref:Lipoprotein n=1 Tax=Hymenobacter monticola TaxID=1705399 RepID=A0ABY4B5J2_9BACT|nr:hypothetical protein [Hymenobacter monticola]UOE33572.1 hypothetical protein MTP16_20915 [Hymenobacter monticola]